MATKRKIKFPSVSLYTLGCRLNQSETAVIKNSLTSRGFPVAGKGQPADIMVINTCTVTAQGDKDTQKLIARLLRLNPKARIALIGCQPQTQKDRLLAWPGVRWVIGNEKKLELADILLENGKAATPRLIVPAIRRKDFSVPFSSADRARTRVNIKIQDGCDEFCSYCEVPYARGRSRSRVFSEIIEEAAGLASKGYQEIVLTGINIAGYSYQKKNLVDVLDALEEVEGLTRIRISSIEMSPLCRVIVRRVKRSTKICRHLHISVQSLSDGVLKRMKRKHNSRDFLDLTKWASSQVPGLCLGTDLIAGFPGETEEEFAEGAEKLKKARLQYCHVFSYSKRQLAKSRNFPGHLDLSVIKQRSGILRELGLRKRQDFFYSLAGQTAPVLFEQRKSGLWTGLTDNYVRVKVKSRQALSNRIRAVRLIRPDGQTMLGELIP